MSIRIRKDIDMMKKLSACILAAHVLVVAMAQAEDIAPPATIAAPLGNAISYQGKLDKNGVPVNGNCNFVFKLYSALTGGSQIGSTVTLSNQPASSGLFSVSLDFGAGAFDGQARWLEIQVQGPGDAGYTTLAPRAAINAAPYALHALSSPASSSQWTNSSGDLTYAGGGVGVLNGSSPFAAGKGVFLEGGSALHGSVFAYNYDALQPLSLNLNGPGGNVGIGTTTPSSRLEIMAQDGLKITGATPYLTLKDTGAGNAQSYVQNLSGDLALIQSGLGGGIGMLLKKDTGRVGVGTSNPLGRIHAESSNETAVIGRHTGSWVGVYGESQSHAGVWGNSTNGIAVVGTSTNTWGVSGENTTYGTIGILGSSTDGVVGIVNSVSQLAGRFENTAAGGTALWANGLAKVKTLQILGGADIVERFETGDQELAPGTVVVIDALHAGELRASVQAYDHRVAGVVSGAGGIAPGLQLGQEGVMDGETPVAMSGRVYVRCTTTNGGIRPGDLLTTSEDEGLAMRATDPERSHGAVIGKAMSSLDAGTGLVLVLVNLH
jgi:hypothetical protein